MGKRIPSDKRTQCSKCGKECWKSSPDDDSTKHVCRDCRKLTHGVNAYRRGCRCDVCRAANASQMREYAARRRAEGRPLHLQRSTVSAVCEQCGGEYKARADAVKAGSAWYCSRRCSNLAKLGLLPDGERPEPKFPRVVPPHHIECEWCGKGLMVKGNRKYCSKRCSSLAQDYRDMMNPESPHHSECSRCGKPMYRDKSSAPVMVCGDCRSDMGAARRKAGIHSKFSVKSSRRLRLYERDNWTCHLCGDPIDRNAIAPAPLSATLDHIIPQSWTLFPDHSDSNLRAAHFICNARRRDLSVEEFRCSLEAHAA